MKLIKGYYAYLALAGGFLLNLAARDNWMLCVVAFALISLGGLSLREVSRWFWAAGICADVMILFEIVGAPGLLPPGLFAIVLRDLSLAPLLLLGCMVFRGVAGQMRQAGKSTLPEWGLLVVWSTGWILSLALRTGLLNEMVYPVAASLANTLTMIGYIALVLEAFRGQRAYLQVEGSRS